VVETGFPQFTTFSVGEGADRRTVVAFQQHLLEFTLKVYNNKDKDNKDKDSTQLSKTNNFLFVFSLLILSLLPLSHNNVCYA
jgi:hypothetical protein